jgi:ATP-dependent protease ClpP protease subunit
MVHKIYDHITPQTLDNLIEVYNNATKKDEIIIYLNSPGGDYNSMEAILDLINTNSSITTLIGYGCLFSSAFELFFSVTCKKRLLGGCNGMYHQSVIDITVNEQWKTEFQSDKSKKLYMTGYMRSKTLETCNRLKMSDIEIKSIKNGKDLYFDPIRMHNFLVVYE